MCAKKSSLLASVTAPGAKMTYVPTQDDTVLRQIAIAKIQPRANEDLRDLKPHHVVDLASTICAAGLLQPIAVDSRYRLVAGKHRIAAFKLLSGLKACADIEARKKLFESIVEVEGVGEKFAEELQALDPAAYEEKHPGGVIPCRLMPYDSEKQPEAALIAESMENLEREGFTPAEVKTIAERMKSYGFVDVRGRPAAGQRPLNPAIAMMVGKSLRQVQRMLARAENPEPPRPASPLPPLLKALERALPEMQASRSPKLKAAAQHFRQGLEDLRSYLQEHSAR